METDFKALVNWALLPQQGVYTFEKARTTYLWRDGIIEALIKAEKIPPDEITYLISYLDNGRADHGLGTPYEFMPPVVPFANRGIYYQIVEMPDVERVFEILNEMDPRQIGRFKSNKPMYELYYSRALGYLMEKLYPNAARNTVSDSIVSFLHKQIIPTMEKIGWATTMDGRRFEKDIPLDTEERSNVRRYLVGDDLDPRQMNEYVAMDVYDKSYYLPDAYFPEEFLAHRSKIAVEFGYIYDKNRGLFRPKPVELPEDIEAIGEAILAEPENVITSDLGVKVIRVSTIQDELRDRGITLTEKQIKDQLLGSQGEWRKPLVMKGFRLATSHCYPRNFPEIESDSHNSFLGVSAINIGNGGKDLTRKMDFASGFPILINAITIDSTSGTLVYLDMVGTRNSIKANWAALMQVRYFSYLQIRFKVATAANHVIYQQHLPSGLYQMVMINKAAMPAYINPTVDVVYLINPEHSDKMPSNFGGTLDKMLEVPILPEWIDHLWIIGRITGLVDFAGNPTKQINQTVWKIRNSENWNELISTAVAAKEISIQ